jgi:ADP-ribose pyrophosphatase
MIRPWPIRARRELLSTRIFRLTARSCSSPRTGQEHEFFVLEAGDWVNVIPLLDDGRVVLVRQYRHGREEVTLEIPGGMVDESDTDPAAAARRELLEETGYVAERVAPIGVIAPNPAIQANLCHSFVASGLRLQQQQALDGTEEIELDYAPLREIPQLIRDGRITHSLVVVAFCHYLGLQIG